MSDRGDATTGGPGGDGSGSGDDADQVGDEGGDIVDDPNHVGEETDGEHDGDEGWRFSIEDVGPSGAEATGRGRSPIEPGDPSLENVLFVLLGVVLTLFVLSRLVIG